MEAILRSIINQKLIEVVKQIADKIGGDTPITPNMMIKTLENINNEVYKEIAINKSSIFYANAITIYLPAVVGSFMINSYISKISWIRNSYLMKLFFSDRVIKCGYYSLPIASGLLIVRYTTLESYSYIGIIMGPCSSIGLHLFLKSYLKHIGHPIISN
jgi:hypothetical protein